MNNHGLLKKKKKKISCPWKVNFDSVYKNIYFFFFSGSICTRHDHIYLLLE